MEYQGILFELVVIFSGVALLATLFLFLKQPIIISYIALGMMAGPFGLGVISSPKHIESISQVGIILLLFLIGLNLPPRKMVGLFRQTLLLTLFSCAVFAVILGLTAFIFGFSQLESLLIGAALMFSSTIVSLKLLPTSSLHQKRMGELMVSVLLLQDILAIGLLLMLEGSSKANLYVQIPILIFKGVALTLGAILIFKFGVLRLFQKFDTIQEYLLVMALGWCLGVAGVAHASGLSYEIGAFIAGCSVAISPISLVLAERLKPLREFFLILFFFAMGTRFNFLVVKEVFFAGLFLSLVVIGLKPVVFYWGLRFSSERKSASWEFGLRLGQSSEFSLLIAFLALTGNQFSDKASYVIQLATILSLIFSTYLVSYRLSTPIAAQSTLRKD